MEEEKIKDYTNGAERPRIVRIRVICGAQRICVIPFMKVIKITKQSIAKAVEILKRGGTVVYPTETAYALGCDAANARAAAKIFKIKNRPKEKGLPMICATKKMASDFFKFGKIERKLAKKYWPGPLTMILPSAISHQLSAVRVSSNKVARAISRGLGRPIISTSANISGKGAVYDSKKIIAEFAKEKYQPASTCAKRGEPDLALDAGKLPPREPSTIVKIENTKIIILRQGKIRI